MKRALILLLVFSMLLPVVSCRSEEPEMTSDITETSEAVTEPVYEFKYQRYAAMSPEEIVAELTLEQKAAQMVQPLLNNSNVQGMHTRKQP